MRYDFVDLKIFLTLARTLNITHTAEEVHLTPSAVSLRLKKFEDALGVKLFDRGPRGISITAAGTALKPHAVSILGSLSSIDADLRGYQPPTADTIRVATNTTGSQNLFCHAGRRFLERYPVRLRIIDSRSAAAVEAVLRGTVDMSFGLEDCANLYSDQLEIIPMLRDRVVCIVPEDHPLSGRTSVDYNTVLQYDFISLQEHMPVAKAMRERALNRGCKFDPITQVPSFDQMIRYVESGIGAAILPESALIDRAHFSDNECFKPIVTIPLDESFAQRRLAVSLRKDAPVNELCYQLIETCRTMIRGIAPEALINPD